MNNRSANIENSYIFQNANYNSNNNSLHSNNNSLHSNNQHELFNKPFQNNTQSNVRDGNAFYHFQPQPEFITNDNAFNNPIMSQDKPFNPYTQNNLNLSSNTNVKNNSFIPSKNSNERPSGGLLADYSNQNRNYKPPQRKQF